MYTRFSQHVRSLDSVASNPAAGASRSLAAGVAAPRRRARRCSAACRAAPQLREAEAATDSAPSTSSTIDASSGSSGSSSSSSTRSSGGSSYSTSALGGAAAGASAAPRLGAPQAAALLATLGAAGGSTYQVLASQPQLPPLADATQALGLGAGALLGGAAAFAAAAKAALGDRFHLELHRGRLYVSVGVPSRGPPLEPDAVVVRPTGDPRLGNGAYAARPILAGTHVADYTGELLDRATFFGRYPDGVGDFATAIDDEWVLDAAAEVADTASFHAVHMNHSSSRANVRRFYHRAAKRVAFFADRDIAVGEELLYDYGRDYWRGREHLELP